MSRVSAAGVRFWHLADMRAAPMNVCFEGESGHANDVFYEYTL